MKTKYTLLLSLVLGFLSIVAFKADDDPFTLLLKKMALYVDKNPQEKVHLHLDKPYYAVGDDIWFKAYVLNTATGAPTELSQALYVELIDEADSIKKQQKLFLVGGTTWGDFHLADSLTEGNYRIRAYTQYMRNAGAEFFYDKTIKIGNSWANKVFTKASYEQVLADQQPKIKTSLHFADKEGKPYGNVEVSYVAQVDYKNMAKGKAQTDAGGNIHFTFNHDAKNTATNGTIRATLTLPDKEKVTKTFLIRTEREALDIQFFPEGGALVLNLPMRVGIKATKSNGRGKKVSGAVIDHSGNIITSFTSTDLGMGSFYINAQPNTTYTAVIKEEDGAEQKLVLPAAQPLGYALSINNLDSSKVLVKISMSPELMNKGMLNLVAQNQGTVYATAQINSEKQVTSFSIPKKEIPSGILQLTLFDPSRQPVAERLVFITNAEEVMDVQVSSSKKTYSPREKVDLTLEAHTRSKAVNGTFSVAVTNSDVVKPDLDHESHILATLLLTSDLPGYIERANHYFKDKERSTLEDLDHLLLTQGWRRFLWKNVMQDRAPVQRFKPETSLSISGTLTNLSGKPIPNGKVSLFSSSGGLLTLDTLADDKGRFVFDRLLFGDSTKFVVQGRTEKGKKNTEIKIDVIPGQVVTRNKNTGDIEVNVNESISSYIKQSDSYFDELTKKGVLQRTQLLKEVNIVEKRPVIKNSSNLNGSGNADAVITSDQLNNSFSISQALQGRVAGLIIRNGIPYLTRYGATSPMQVILDGMYVEADFLDMINVQDVESIEVLKSGGHLAIYGSRGGGGILLINTKRGLGMASVSYTPGIITHLPKGYNASRTFYQPKYEDGNSSAAPDLRTTIYWNPQLISDSTGVAKMSYYNADTKGAYRVVVEGMNATGKLGRTVYTYEVK